MRSRWLIALLATAVACTSPEAGADAVVRDFYATRLALDITGLPTPVQLAAIEHDLGASLLGVLLQAQRLQAADRKNAPDDKPRLVEGDLFSSLFEGPTTVHVDSAQGTGDFHHVVVHCTHADSSGTTEWADTFTVVREAGRYVIADVAYGGTWGFANKGSLMAALRSAATPDSITP